ncbi:UDP-N-acetylglucosamine 2-epimerase (non-hydrolyzing) [Polynucleobacter campilacus]|uniref:UDP-N-acetylglucosamine 2-epimerase (non-hydrolyzing) n=2 Tax=Polynucleobacter campilacus TaxID=1743163 RepID=A0A254Q8G2_9BURK|nr:UDP-N-acetylglucosamine 2-epimerase (non-hydrolyzing) [Polynucleobacter campilacus]
MVPVIKALKAVPTLEIKVCVTGQHRQMLDQVLNLFDIKPDIDLNIMKPSQTLSDITASILLGLNAVFADHRPDLLLVHGDTTSACAAALAAYYFQIPVGHVEAGLRTGDINSPWPEEGSRQIIGRLSSLHFAPTKSCKANLMNEGISESKIYVTGNTVIDSLLITLNGLNKSKEQLSNIKSELEKISPEVLERSDDWKSGKRKLILITGHRRENFGDGVLNLCSALTQLTAAHEDIDFVYPVHMNPNIHKVVNSELHGVGNIFLIPPLDYLIFVYLMSLSHIIITDSGGIQEEAPSLGKPVLVMRDSTERPEAIEAGTAKLIGMRAANIVSAVKELLVYPDSYSTMSNASNPYGDGTTGKQIAEIIANYALKKEENEFK